MSGLLLPGMVMAFEPGSVITTLELGGSPEQGVADGEGMICAIWKRKTKSSP